MSIYVGEMFWYDMILKYSYKNGVRKKKDIAGMLLYQLQSAL